MLRPHTDPNDQPQRDAFSGWRVSHKITAGYALALSLAIGGTVIGIVTGNRYQQQVWQRVTIAQQESNLIQQLRNETLQAEIQQYTLLDDYTEREVGLQHQVAILVEAETRIAPVWGNFTAFSINHQAITSQYGQQFRNHLLKLNSHGVSRYFYELRQLSAELREAEHQTPSERQRLVSAFLNQPVTREFSQLSRELAQQSELADQAVTQAQAEIQTANQQNIQVILGSLLAATIVASLLGWLISRSIGKSLGAVEQVAKSVIETGDFGQRCTIDSQDEIGSLATSLNQLITWVESHTQDLETHRNQLATMVAAQTQELRAIIDYLGDGLFVCDGRSGQISRCNPAFGEMFGLKSAAAIGQLPQNILGPDMVQLIERHQRDPHPMSAEVALADGRLGQALISPILSEANHAELSLEGSIILVRDVTHDREIEQMKTDFLSTVSHELRTPLTSVIGFAKLIQKKLEDTIFPLVPTTERKTARSLQQVRDNLHIIVSEGSRLTSLINDVLDIAKIEAGKVEWKMAAGDLTDIVNQAIGATSVLAQTSELPVTLEIAADLPAVLVDHDRIVQVLINLLSNAIKFTEQGTVICQIDQADQMVVVRVRDTGVGLAPEDLEAVFEKFKQVGEVMTNKPKGTGLGLPICKQIIEHHQGRIWAESELGQGSTFCFTVPIATTTPAPSTIPSYPIAQPHYNQPQFNQLVQQIPDGQRPTGGHRPSTIAATADNTVKTILVVDDEPSIRQLLRQELESQNYQVQEAGDGLHALEVIRATPPDLIILDIMMPKMNGLDLAAILKTNPETSMIPIIILSIMEEQARGYRLGVDRYQSKPINIGVLFHDISLLLAQGAKNNNHRVLTVDGEVSTINALMSVLLDRGYQPIAVWNGQTGIDVALANQQHMVIIDSGIVSGTVAPHDPDVKTYRLDNGNVSIFFVLRSRSGINLPGIHLPGSDILPDRPTPAESNHA
jgi:PAS domain S-box-containing protein